ncbi:hypothetical protein FACS1894170_05660 [Planctomycetales bacterium]|nr:hypothetical protein FACS1894170_05660 [Planctomycetales bacterium]
MAASWYYKNAVILIAVLTGYAFFAGTIRSEDAPLAEPVQSNTAQANQQATDWQNLGEVVKKSNMDIDALLKYGTPELRDEISKLQNDPFGIDKEIQDKLKTQQKQIAEGKFYLDTALELDADKIKVGDIKTETEIRSVALRNKLTGDPDLWTFGFQDFLYEAGQGETGTLTGKTEDMKELYRNRDNYTLRIYITGLKIAANEKDPFADTEPEKAIIGDNAQCTLLQYEICKKGNVPALKYADVAAKVKSAKEKFVAKKKAEVERIAKEVQAKQEAEAQAKAETERQAAEERRIIEAKAAEERRIAEVKAAEEKRKADEIRRKTDAVTKSAEEQLQKAAAAVNDVLEAAKRDNDAEVANAVRAANEAAKEAGNVVAEAKSQGIDTSAASKAADKAKAAVKEAESAEKKMFAARAEIKAEDARKKAVAAVNEALEAAKRDNDAEVDNAIKTAAEAAKEAEEIVAGAKKQGIDTAAASKAADKAKAAAEEAESAKKKMLAARAEIKAEASRKKAAAAVNDALEAAKKGNDAEVDNAIKAATEAAKEAEEIVAEAKSQGIDTSDAVKAENKAKEYMKEAETAKAKMLSARTEIKTEESRKKAAAAASDALEAAKKGNDAEVDNAIKAATEAAKEAEEIVAAAKIQEIDTAAAEKEADKAKAYAKEAEAAKADLLTARTEIKAEEASKKAVAAVEAAVKAALEGNDAEVDNAIKTATEAAKEAEEIVAEANKQGIDTAAASKAADKAKEAVKEAVQEAKKAKEKMLAEKQTKQAVEEVEAALKKADGLARQAENSSKVVLAERILEKTKEAEKNVRNAAAKLNELTAGFSFPELTARAENAVSRATDAVTKAKKAVEKAKENDPDYVTDLREWVKDNGWEQDGGRIQRIQRSGDFEVTLLRMLTCGTMELQNDLAMATRDNNAADIKNTEENIKLRRKQIAAKKFYCDVSYRLEGSQFGNGQATVHVELTHNNSIFSWRDLYSLNRGVEWWFCLPNCKHKDTASHYSGVDAAGGSISGEANSIAKLINNHAHYFLRVYLTDLKLNPNGRNNIICKIDRYEIRETGDDDWKPKNYVPPADVNSGDIAETDLPLVTEFKKVQVIVSGETFSGQMLTSAPARGSMFALLGLKTGDVITHINGKPINELTPEDMEKARGQAKVRYIKDGRQGERTIDIP